MRGRARYDGGMTDHDPDDRAIAMLDAILEQTGGPVTAAEQAWADAVLRGDHPLRGAGPDDPPPAH